MSSDAAGEINFVSFRPGFIPARLGWKFIGKTNVTINEKGKRKREERVTGKRDRTARDRAMAMTRSRDESCTVSVANQSIPFLPSCPYFVDIYVYISLTLICTART